LFSGKGERKMTQYHHVDIDSYVERITSGPCFICEMQAGNPDYEHHIIYEDEKAIVFLNKYPVLYGYTLVAPRRHCEHVTGDFTREEYLSLQDLIYRVSQAVSQVVPTERMYILSLGSQQGNSHVHWHIAPLPPGVPMERQQFDALRLEKGVLSLSEEEMASLAARIGQAMEED
jgi:diadenosine tetraphosphate (Ap4A) HIT family hydrolase